MAEGGRQGVKTGPTEADCRFSRRPLAMREGDFTIESSELKHR